MNRRDHELAAHQPWLRRLARRFARSSTRADDLVQETYVTALRNAPPDAQLRPWLHAVMRKIAWGQVRSEQRRTIREESFSTLSPALTMPELLDDSLDREQLNAALARLPEPFQSTLVERFFKDRSCADIARAENIPAGTVRWRQSRGIELLRAELRPVARRHRQSIWMLPFMGAGEQLIARIWRALTARGPGTALWLWLAALIIYAISASSVEPTAASVSAAGAGPHRRDAQLAVSPVAVDHIDGDASEDDDPGMLIRLGGRAGAGIADDALSADPVGAGRDRHRSALASRDELRRLADEACKQHPASWRCLALRAGDVPYDQALCDLARQQVLMNASMARSASTFARRYLTAALQANRALAHRMGCPWARNDTSRSAAGGGREQDREPQPDPEQPTDDRPPPPPPHCEVEDQLLLTCTWCDGEPPLCGPAECMSWLSIDGVNCTQCRDAQDNVRLDCPLPPQGACDSTLDDQGRLCSTCGSEQGPPECLPAECTVDDTCLRCVDAKGRTAADCSRNYQSSFAASFGGAAEGSTFSSCNLSVGDLHATTSCRFPGTQTCAITTDHFGTCLTCKYPGGSGSSRCAATIDELPDPLADRPASLPPPGECASWTGANGASRCTSCSYQDMSATTICTHEQLVNCGYVPDWLDAPDPSCQMELHCERPDGTNVRLCNTINGYQPQ